MLLIPLIELLMQAKDRVILFLGAHCDDIALGAGGTLLRLKQTGVEAWLQGVVFTGGSDPVRRSEEETAGGAFGLNHVDVLDHPDGDLPSVHVAVLRQLQRLRDKYKERLAAVFVTNKSDRHQD